MIVILLCVGAAIALTFVFIGTDLLLEKREEEPVGALDEDEFPTLEIPEERLREIREYLNSQC